MWVQGCNGQLSSTIQQCYGGGCGSTKLECPLVGYMQDSKEPIPGMPRNKTASCSQTLDYGYGPFTATSSASFDSYGELTTRVLYGGSFAYDTGWIVSTADVTNAASGVTATTSGIAGPCTASF